MPFLKSGDVISGREGTAFMTIDGVVQEMFYLRNLEATIEKNKADVNTLGSRNTQKKTTGWEGTGTMEIYAVTPVFVQMAIKYIKQGIDTYFTIKTTNEDPTSTIGRQSILLKDVNMDNFIVASLDVDEEFLAQEMDFTFSDVDLLEGFKAPKVFG